MGEIVETIVDISPAIAIITEIPKKIQQMKNLLSKEGFEYFVMDECKRDVLICSKNIIKQTDLIEIPEHLKRSIAIVEFQGLIIIGLFVNGFSPCKENNGLELGKMIIEFLNTTKKQLPNANIIAVGDFDCGYRCKNSYEKLKAMEDFGWKNIWESENKYKTEETFSFQNKTKTAKSRPDHLFATEKIAERITNSTFLLNYLDVRLPPKDICLSDHAPLIAELHL